MANIPPLVSVQMITYNHEPFIAQAIEGVLMQKTNFKYELVIGEDCSTDNTRKICEEYARNYPDIIRLLPSEKNLGMFANGTRTMKACMNGKYIGICEGDDYWTDPYKLQKQVDFLEKNSRIIAVAHLSKTIFEGVEILNQYYNSKTNAGEYSKRKLLLPAPFHTSSIVFRNIVNFSHPSFPTELLRDYSLIIILSSLGRIKVINEVMSVYRRNLGGTTNRLSVEDIYRINIDMAEKLSQYLKGFYFKKLAIKSHWHKYYLFNSTGKLSFLQKLILINKSIWPSFYFFPSNIPGVISQLLYFFTGIRIGSKWKKK